MRDRVVADSRQQPSLRRYLRALWNRPGFKLTVVSLIGFGSVIVMRHGWANLIMTLAIALPLGLALGYRQFRRTGRV